MENKIWRIIDLLKWTSEYFAKNGIESARLNAELLLCHTINFERIGLYTNFDKPLSPEELSFFKSLIKRRVDREPLQYILGSVNFLGIKLQVDSSVLIPRNETEFIVDIVIKKLSAENRQLKILDIGTGSGCIAISLAKALPNAEVTAIDSSEKALLIAENNAVLNGVKNITFKKVDILKEAIFEKYDVIVSNPPYISNEDMAELEPEIYKFEPVNALTDFGDGLGFYRKFSSIFPEILEITRGSFFMEIGFDQSSQIKEIFYETGYKVKFTDDFNGIKRLCYYSGNEILN